LTQLNRHSDVIVLFFVTCSEARKHYMDTHISGFACIMHSRLV